MISLRPITLDDCTHKYVAWLNDPKVNKFLETRHEEQTLDSIRAYVKKMLKSVDSHLMAIIHADLGHIGNIKIGPINERHSCADLSYFIGDPNLFGKGYASKAVGLACEHGFKKLGLHRLQAGCYARNEGSRRVLLRNGFSHEGTLHRALKTDNGWEDHHIFGRAFYQAAI